MTKTASNLIGAVFYRLTCIENLGKDTHRNQIYLCQCSCGNKKIIRASSLLAGYTKSCGCLSKELLKKRSITHGLGKPPYYYRAWCNIKQRCTNSNHNSYKFYGEKGVILYPTWANSFDAFYSYILNNLGERPSKAHSLDRINGNKGYEPNNIRWATPNIQGFNKTFKMSKSGFRGIRKDKHCYRAFINIQGRRKYIARFKTLEEAVECYKQTALKIFGELPPEYK